MRLGRGQRSGKGCLAAAAAVVCLAVALPSTTAGAERYAAPVTGKAAKQAKQSHAYRIARRYIVRFYPRWFTWKQEELTLTNRIQGPIRISPIWGIVVAPNDDTIYTSAVLDVSKKPQVLTIPRTDTTYSVLTLDVFGTIIETKISTTRPGTYALVGPDWEGNLPDGVRKIRMPENNAELIIRSDKYSASGENQIAEARRFRRELRMTSLSNYREHPREGLPFIAPELFTAPRLKVMADEALTTNPTPFLNTLQAAMHSKTTRPLTESDRRLSRRFDHVFDDASPLTMSRIFLAANAAHTQIVDRWLSHTDSNYWVNFDNIGDWGRSYLDRAALTEYIQLGNGASTAGYYDGFFDYRGVPLDTSAVPAYTLTFSKEEIPDAERFWSLTAYLPESVTLVPNSARKYVVGSYTPGLTENPDGSVTIYMQPTRPVRVPVANWLPVPEGPFNVLLRVYGPTGNTAPGKDYVPPAIKGSTLR
jgi:hypothetical protein